MAKSVALFDLIKTLSKSEKRYFRLFSAMQEGKKNYLLLFDFLEQMPVYDEEEVLRNFKGAAFCKQLHSAKNYLYRLIMRSLRSYHANDSVDSRLANLMADVELLNRRGLYDLRDATLRRARKLAAKFERHHYLVEILTCMLKYSIERREKKMKKVQDSLAAEIKRTLKIMDEEYRLCVMNYELSLELRQRGRREDERQRLKSKIRRSELLDDIENLDSFNSKIYYLNIHKFLYRLDNEAKAAWEMSSKLVETWRENPHQIKDRPRIYKLYLSNFMSDAHLINSYDQFIELLDELRSLPSGNFTEEAETFQNLAFVELLYFLNTGKYEKGRDRLPFIEQGLEQYKGKINKAREITFYYNISILYFVLNDYDAALAWGNRILQDRHNEHRRDLHRGMLVLQLVYHYKLDNHELLVSLLSAVPKRLKRKKALSIFEKTVISAFEKLLFSTSKKHTELLFSALMADLQLILGNSAGAYTPGLGEIIEWMR